MTNRPLLDTHVWVWWMLGDSRLPAREREALDDLPGDNRPLLCDISLWEVALLVQLGRLRLDGDLEDWLQIAASPATVTVLPITSAVVAEMNRLPTTFHQDPADRLIAATSRAAGVPLATHDVRIRRSKLVSLWAAVVSLLAVTATAADPPAAPAGVPVLTIETTGQAGVESREQSIGCRVAVDPRGGVDAAGKPFDALPATAAKVRGRGNTTWDYPKKPYRVKFDAPVDVLGMGAARTWVLLADYIDPSGLRNATAFELGRRLGMPFTPQCHHVWLVLDGEPRGLSLLTEQTEIVPERVVTDPQAGFLVEFDDYDGEEIFSTPTLDLPLKIKRPHVDDLSPDARTAEIARITNIFADLEQTLAAPDGPGDYAALLDVDALVDWYLVHEITRNVEPCHPKSCFFHRGPDGRIVAGPLWDFDWAYDYEGEADEGLVLKDAFWFQHLFRDPAFRARVKARWTAIKAAHVDTLPDFVATLAASIRPAVEADLRLWPTDEDVRTPADAAGLRAWLVTRIASLDTAIRGLE